MHGEEVVFSTLRGAVTRQRIGDISIQSRAATGVKLQNTDKDDTIVMVDIVPESETVSDEAASQL
jgi:DNA gyrase subunit A